MPKMLNDGAVEYEDGTPATESQVRAPPFLCYTQKLFWTGCEASLVPLILLQMGKDVVTFLTWAAEPEMEERKLVFVTTYALTVLQWSSSVSRYSDVES